MVDRFTYKGFSQEATLNPQKWQRPAVDLSREQRSIAESGRSYWPMFVRQIESFSREVDTHAGMSQFFHGIDRDEHGRVTLFYMDGDRKVIARRSYLEASLDPRKPAWLQAREQREYEAIVQMEAMLEIAPPGAVLLEASPGAFVQSDEELAGTMYSERFSFLRTHQVAHDTEGNEILQGRALRHYLDGESQTKLFQDLTGEEDVTLETLLGTVGVLGAGPEMADIASLDDVSPIINAIDESHKIPRGEINKEITDAMIEDCLRKLRPVLKYIFNMLRRDAVMHRARYRRSVENALADYRACVRDFCSGNDHIHGVVAKYKNPSFIHENDGSFRPRFEDSPGSCGEGAYFTEPGGRAPQVAGYRPGSYDDLAKTHIEMDESKDKREAVCGACCKTLRNPVSVRKVFQTGEIKCDHPGCSGRLSGDKARALVLSLPVAKKQEDWADLMPIM